MKRAATQSVLVISMPPMRFATRSRKGARAYAAAGYAVRFVSLQQAGRTGRRDSAGTSTADGVTCHQIAIRRPRTGTSVATRVWNLMCCYLPAITRLTAVVVKSPAKVVHVTGPSLIPAALLHRLRHGSRVIVDINERPGAVNAKGSLFSVVSKLEPLLISFAASRASMVTCVTPGHARILEQSFGVSKAVVVRNAPLASWRHGWSEPPATPPLRIVTVGSLFPGRAIEMCIQAVGDVHRRGGRITFTIAGVATPEYHSSLLRLIAEEGLEEVVSLSGAVDGSEVSALYASGHVGLALYEATDPGNDSLSNKIIETVASARPVLAGDLPENREFVRSLAVGWVTPVNRSGIGEAFEEMLKMPDSALRELSLHCNSVADDLSWENEFSSVLAHVAERRSA